MRIAITACLLAGFAASLGLVPPRSVDDAPPTDAELHEIGLEAVVYGYPLVLMETTRRVSTNVDEPQPNGHAPMNLFGHMQRYPDAKFKEVVRANVDTLYSSAWLDLTAEPIVLSVPDTGGRYYLMPMLDAWTNIFASPGKRTTGTKAGQFAIVGPGWKGSIPEGVSRIAAPTNMVWILGRTQANGPADYDAVHALQREYRLTPLSAWGKPYHAPKGRTDPAIDTKTPPPEQVRRMTSAEFFKRMAELMKSNPPAKADGPALARLAKIGIVPGQDFDMSQLDPAVARALEGCVQEALDKLDAASKNTGHPVKGWNVPPSNLAQFGTDYGTRGVVALIGLGANLPADAIYPTAFVDSDGKPLDGQNRYTIHFEKGQTPPARAFWSITMYDAQSFFVDNPINRYNIAAWMPLTYNADGSLDLLIQHDAPPQAQQANWLPAPQGPFSLTMRMYWPDQAALTGGWKPPGIRNVGK